MDKARDNELLRLPPASAMAGVWDISIQTVYQRTHGRIQTSARAIATLARELDLDCGLLCMEFARRRARFLADH